MRRALLLQAVAMSFLAVEPAAAQSRRRSAAPDRDERRLDVYQRRHRELRTSFAEKLKAIAADCEQQGLAKEAGSLRHVAEAIGTVRFSSRGLQRKVQPGISRDLPAAQREWRNRYRKARSDAANGLYRIARDAIRDNHASYAYELIRETARFDPDHADARRLLGYVRMGDRWVTPFEKFKAEKGEVWHEKYGWLPKTHVARYEKGERYYVPRGGRRGNWIPVAKETEHRRAFRNAWEVRTEHYLVKTNHSLEEGVRVAKALEDFYGYFFETFASFFNSREQMRRLFAGGSASSSVGRPYIVHYYRTKDEYVKTLQPKFPDPNLKKQIVITNGMYLFTERICHFYHNPKADNTPTLYHEATHQVFYESLKRQRLIAERAHFWIIEGISCYMESFKVGKNGATLGDPAFPRFRAAKIRYVTDRYYVPLQRFAAMGREIFQTHRDIRRNYSQASGLAKFFMEHDGGKYREALIEHLSQLYRNDSKRFVRVKGLDELTNMSYVALDGEYDRFIRNMPERATAAKQKAPVQTITPTQDRLP
jgi:hypothetical protein